MPIAFTFSVSPTGSGVAPDPTRALSARLEDLDKSFPLHQAPSAFGTLTYRSAGTGPAVVLLHGIGSAAGCWLDVALMLRDGLRVIAWNAPGYAGSTPLPQAHLSADDYADALHQLLAHAGVSECVLVGHSLGAIVAGAYAAREAGNTRVAIRRLVLLSPAQGYASHDEPRREAVRTGRLTLLEAEGIDGIAAQRASALLSDAAPPAMREWAAWNMRQITPTGYRQAVSLLCDSDLLSRLAPAMPVDVRVGNHDVITPAAHGQAVAQAWHASFALIDGAGHACHIERPAQVADIVRGSAVNDGGVQTEFPFA
ncbi:Non-heme chloroperoxidase [Achromobacter spanius]|uniref:alpha/beta fold hydrolase n=1 Tax=Achromobacter spanius TaxID=217203 RepID=UPI000D947F1B|nr:alpha/beta fold hydrolase [Achromobacter spanius]CAB3699458.1 2-succinyl-6-hydroxy-2, 4-cyclohexadiene-1-carboxylate synthase [Achromobacter spanius]SPT36867.1 Non-heme chloroperoxidase [Achromobacter denitrificans]VEE56813.1 Non-heme chloroperoxidase [Achromobacter spanius]